MEVLILTLDVAGKLMIAFTALRVHHSVLSEKRLDIQVLTEMKVEQNIGILGVVFIIIAYFLELQQTLL